MILDAQLHTPPHLSVAGFTTVIALLAGMPLWIAWGFSVLWFGPSDPPHAAPERGRA